jgi:predicted CopG family antitoxin
MLARWWRRAGPDAEIDSIAVGMKTLTIRDEVYEKLASMKREGESFSELFERLVDDRSSLEVLKSMRGSLEFGSPGETERFIHDISSKRSEVRD